MNSAESTSELKLRNEHAINLSEFMKCSNHLCDANENILSDICKYEEPTPELERVKQEIEKIISQKENVNKENEVLKIYKQTFSQVNGQNTAFAGEIQKHEALQQQNQNDFTIPEIDIDRSSPDGQEIDCEFQSLSTTKNPEVLILEEKITLLEKELIGMATDKKELLEKNE